MKPIQIFSKTLIKIIIIYNFCQIYQNIHLNKGNCIRDFYVNVQEARATVY